ncbi:hypothetical protein A6A04_07185 [Paramagnetospirillum marisnigri]|uniref:histidine kinase n=2 Tax=Paramagnetospirillum marisnigri TaxID=1285242 RepID=A0A178MC84_9PROT|nr:hypothetical protein A6A04_07185 [Paramagnetospirillum marisnigri]
MLSSDFVETWRNYQAARQVLAANSAIDSLLQAAQNFAFERGRTNVVLNGPGPISDDNRAFLTERRKAADDALSEGIRHFDMSPNPELERIRVDYAAVTALRIEADQAFALPRGQRPTDLPDRWVRAQTTLLDSITDLIANETLKVDRFTAVFRLFTRIKLQAFNVRDAFGLESSRYATSLSGKPLDSQALSSAMLLRGRGETSWRELQREVSRADSPNLTEALDTVRHEFFVRFRPLEDQVIQASLTGQPQPWSVAEFTKASVPALDSIAAFLKVATKETAAFGIANASRARERLLVQAAVAIGVTLLSVATLYVILGRLLRPLQRIQSSLAALADGNTTIPVPTAPPRDEIGAMWAAVESFRRSLLERKRAEALLRDSEAQLRAVVSNEPECIKLVDGDGALIQMNPAGLQMVEAVSQEQLVGRHIIEVVAPEYRQAFSEMHQAVMAGETRELQFEVIGLRGTRCWLETHAVPMDFDGRRVHLAVTRDISSRKALELDLKRSNAELERFAYVASHDLRQPLRMVSSYLTLLERHLAGRLNEDEQAFIDFAVNGAKRMDRMIIDLLDYSRIGRDTVEMTAVALDEVVGHAIANLQGAIDDSAAMIEIPTNLPTVMGSDTELERLFRNLIGNALKFQAEGRSPHIRIQCREAEADWEISVSDNGIGIAPEDHQRLFQIFQRLVSQDQYPGSGIGLASCRKIIEHHHGRIWVESLPDEGTTFRFTLPKSSVVG